MRKTFNRVLATVVAVVAMSQAPAAQGTPGVNHGGSGGKSLAGAWFSTVTPTLIPPFVSVGTFERGGTLTNISSVSLAFPPGVIASGVPESPGYGVWAKTGPQTYAVTFLTITGDGTGGFAGTQKVRATLTIGPDGDQFDGVFQVDVLDPGGSLIVSDTGTIHGVRIKVQPL